MILPIDLTTGEPEIAVTARQALNFWFHYEALHDDYMIMGADWQVDPEPGEEDWFLELTADELETGEFLEEFAEARLALWKRH